jgi:NADH dehydrogenase [ubiquinone] 1 alpha subcomplex assembly factor 7
MSELEAYIRSLISEEGPVTVERFMELSLGHPEYGYYMNRDPFGASGDFTTAPEISQMFGELIGLWTAEVWATMGRPNPLRFVELGPGRGTLMSDALRAARVAPEFRNALDVTLVEMSPTLAEIQHETLLTSGAPVAWAATLSEVPEGPAVFIGNEFLDALPVRQYVRNHNRWRERVVWVDRAGQLAFAPGRQPEPFITAQGEEGDIIETSPAAHRIVYELAGRLQRQGGAALFIDYGHGVTTIGECDITAHVDFAAMARTARAAGAAVYGPVDQGDFLREIGLETRAKALSERSPDRAEEFEQSRRRLMGKDVGEMGALFKAMAIANRDLPPPPGFEGLAT